LSCTSSVADQPATNRVETVEHHSHPGHVVVHRHSAGDGEVTLTVSGEVNINNAHHLRSEISNVLGESRTQQLIVDLAHLGYIDSTGVTALITGFNLAQKRCVPFGIANPRGPVLRVLTVLGLTEALTASP